MESLCQERLALARKVSEAITTVYWLREEQEAAKARKDGKADEFREALMHAREIQRKAERALREHIEQHGCKI